MNKINTTWEIHGFKSVNVQAIKAPSRSPRLSENIVITEADIVLILDNRTRTRWCRSRSIFRNTFIALDGNSEKVAHVRRKKVLV